LPGAREDDRLIGRSPDEMGVFHQIGKPFSGNLQKSSPWPADPELSANMKKSLT
jgi:hypothetical protein